MMLEKIAQVRLLVVGDVMLDRYWFGDVSRISPEAPVPVVKVERLEERPGGAANVARNAAALGAQTALISVIAEDIAAILENFQPDTRVTPRDLPGRNPGEALDAYIKRTNGPS